MNTQQKLIYGGAYREWNRMNQIGATCNYCKFEAHEWRRGNAMGFWAKLRGRMNRHFREAHPNEYAARLAEASM